MTAVVSLESPQNKRIQGRISPASMFPPNGNSVDNPVEANREKPECIRVACRVRPADHDAPRMWVTHGKVVQAAVVQPGYGIEIRPLPEQKDMPSFTFEQVFSEDATNAEVYERFGKAAVEKAIEGCKATLLVYGQTGSGKTHTISGSSERAGLFAHAVHDIFRAAATREAEGFSCTLSVVAIYNERALDMLHDGAPEPLTVVGPGVLRNRFRQPATKKTLCSVQEALETFRIAELRRHYAATLKNIRSSRSHSIFILHIDLPTKLAPPPVDACSRCSFVEDGDESESGTAAEEEEGEPVAITRGQLYLVDLAGSESTKESGATGSSKREAENINKGLLALTEVLSHMSRNKGGRPPYRRSALTRVLQPCLGGPESNAFASMVFCIDPLNLRVSEKTLKYGVMTKIIRIQYGINVLKQRRDDDSAKLIAQLRADMEHLRGENRRLEEHRLALLVMWRNGMRPWVPGWAKPPSSDSGSGPQLHFLSPTEFPPVPQVDEAAPPPPEEEVAPLEAPTSPSSRCPTCGKLTGQAENVSDSWQTPVQVKLEIVDPKWESTPAEESDTPSPATKDLVDSVIPGKEEVNPAGSDVNGSSTWPQKTSGDLAMQDFITTYGNSGGSVNDAERDDESVATGSKEEVHDKEALPAPDKVAADAQSLETQGLKSKAEEKAVAEEEPRRLEEIQQRRKGFLGRRRFSFGCFSGQ